MTIAQMRESGNKALSGIPKDLLVVLVVILASSASFGLGILAGRGMAPKSQDSGFWIEQLATTSANLPAAVEAAPAVEAAALTAPKALPQAPAGASLAPTTGKYLASKNGTKYYLPSCSGAKRIKDENKVWFASVEDAQAAGLSPAANCPGL